MPDWAAGTPWRAVTALTIILAATTFRASKWFGSTDTRLDNPERRVDAIGKDIKKIFTRLPTPAAEGSSPVQLTGFGKKISAAAGAKAWATDRAPHLASKAADKPEFEVFEKCAA